VLGLDAREDDAAITHPMDRALLARLAATVAAATEAFENYNYARALEVSETFFWNFTDDFVELIKDRAYGTQGEVAAASAQATLATSLSILLRLFAPVLPFTTEEVWSWWQQGSIHRSEWPSADCVRRLAADGDPSLVDDVAEVLTLVRKAKSEAKVSMKADVSMVTISAPAERVSRLEAAREDLAATGRIADLRFVERSGPIDVAVTLA
jgi:valyl-tRNA synthetase